MDVTAGCCSGVLVLRVIQLCIPGADHTVSGLERARNSVHGVAVHRFRGLMMMMMMYS